MLSKKFKESRLLLNLTQQELADKIGIPQKVVSTIETGKRLYIPTEYLLFLSENKIDLNTIYIKSVKVSFLEDRKNKQSISTFISQLATNIDESKEILLELRKEINNKIIK